MSGHRHAASALYGVSADDREAVLAGLPPADRQILRGHLDELAGLGFDPAAMRQATADSVPPKPAAMPAVTSPADKIRVASAASVAAVLAHEPAALVTDVLALEAWPWSGAVKTALSPASRIALHLQSDRPAPTPAMQAALLALLADALAAQPRRADQSLEDTEEFAGADAGADAATEAVPASLFGRIGNRLSAWTR